MFSGFDRGIVRFPVYSSLLALSQTKLSAEVARPVLDAQIALELGRAKESVKAATSKAERHAVLRQFEAKMKSLSAAHSHR